MIGVEERHMNNWNTLNTYMNLSFNQLKMVLKIIE